MKKTFNKQAHSLLQTQIQGLLNELKTLAPHPTQKNAVAPLSLHAHSVFTPVADNDGVMGSIMIEGFIGGAFNAAANDNISHTPASCAIHMDFDKVGEAASEYIADRAQQNGRGKGSISLLGEHKVIAHDFNHATTATKMDQFLRDLPQRNRIESHIAALVKELDDQNHALYTHAPASMIA